MPSGCESVRRRSSDRHARPGRCRRVQPQRSALTPTIFFTQVAVGGQAPPAQRRSGRFRYCGCVATTNTVPVCVGFVLCAHWCNATHALRVLLTYPDLAQGHARRARTRPGAAALCARAANALSVLAHPTPGKASAECSSTRCVRVPRAFALCVLTPLLPAQSEPKPGAEAQCGKASVASARAVCACRVRTVCAYAPTPSAETKCDAQSRAVQEV